MGARFFRPSHHHIGVRYQDRFAMAGIDALIFSFDRALRTLAGTATSARPSPAARMPNPDLTAEERRHAAGLMRVNHTGEVCAQALYQAQALVARDDEIRRRLAQAARKNDVSIRRVNASP